MTYSFTKIAFTVLQNFYMGITSSNYGTALIAIALFDIVVNITYRLFFVGKE